MSGEARPVTRIPSIFDSDDDSEEETRAPMTFRALNTTTTTNTTTATATATIEKPICESQSEAPPSAPQQTKEPQSLSSNSESDGEPFSPKPEESKPAKPLDSPRAQSSSDDSDDSEDEGGGKDLVFSSKEEKLEDEEDEEREEQDATLVANEEDDINISHSSPENQDGSDDEDDDDSSNSDDDDDDDDESDDEQDRSGSSVEYEGTKLSQEGGSHVVYSPATPLSIKITTAKKGEFSIRQETPSSKSPFQVERERDTKTEDARKQQEKMPSPVKDKEILKVLPKDKKDEEENMELEETRTTEEAGVIQKDKAENVEANKDEDMESNKNLPAYEINIERDEGSEKISELQKSAAEVKSTSSIISEILPLEQKEKEHVVDAPEVEDMESIKEKTLDEEIAKASSITEKSESEPMETTVREDKTSSGSEVIEPGGESDGSDSVALEIESPQSQEQETDKAMRENEDKEDEPMEVEEVKDVASKEALSESSDSAIREPVEEVGGENEKEEEKVIEKVPAGIVTTSREGEEEENVGKAPIDTITTSRKEEKKEEKQVEEAPSDITMSRKDEREEKIEETSADTLNTCREEEEVEEEKEEETEENPVGVVTTSRKEEEEEKETEEAQVDAVTTSSRAEKEEEIEKRSTTQEEVTKPDVSLNSEKQDEERDETPDTEDKLVMDVDDRDVEMEECPEVMEVEQEKRKTPEVVELEEDEREEEKKEADRYSNKIRGSASPPPVPPPVAAMLNSDTDSDATMDAEKAQDIMSGASAKRTKVPLRVEDVYQDSDDDDSRRGCGMKAQDIMSAASAKRTKVPLRVEDVYQDSDDDDSQSMTKPLHEGVGENAAGNGEEGGQSAMTSETDSVDPEDQRDCLSQYSSSRASSTDPFSKVSSCSPRPESPSDTPTRSRQSARPRRSHAPSSEDLARYMEAFKKGWRREIVMRAVQIPPKGGRTRADIYYYSPSGKKLRSRVEIEDYLYNSGIADLTLENFTWMKEPLGFAEEYEQIRHASVKTTTSTVIPARRKPTPGTPTSTADNSPSSTPHSSAPTHVSQAPLTSSSVTITSIAQTPPMVKIPTNIKAGSTIRSPPVSSAPSSSKTSVVPIVPSVNMVIPGITSSNDTPVPRKRGRGRPRKYSPDEAPAKRPRTRTTAVVPIMMKGAGRGDVVPPPPPPPPPQPSTSMPSAHSVIPGIRLHAPLSQGMSLTVQRPILPTTTPMPRQPARKGKHPIVTTGHITSLPPCPPKILTPMLLGAARHRTFHCTGTCPLGGGSVPCLQCVKCLCLFHPECTCMPPQTVTIIQSGAAKFLCPNCYRENKENVGSNKLVPIEPFEPLAHDPSSASSDSDDDDEAEGNQAENEVWVENYTQVCLRPDTPPTPPSSPSPSPSLGPWRGDDNDSRQEHAGELAQQNGGLGEVARGMPALVGLPPNTSIGGQLVQIQQPGSGPACFLLVQGRPGASIGEQIPISSTGPVGVSKTVPSVILPRFSVEHQQQVQLAGPIIMQQQQQIIRSAVPLQMPPQEPPSPQKQERQVGKHYQQYYEAIAQRENSFLGELSQRYLLLRHIFKYLPVRDLLVASQVCHQWRDLALSSSLWETVRLRNVCITDWSEFSRFIDQRNTRNLDLRKMRLREKSRTKKGSKVGMRQKPKANGTPSTSQEASACAQPLQKSSRNSAVHQNQSSVLHADERNRKESQGGSENKESSSKKLHRQKSIDGTKSSETRNKKLEDASESSSKEVKEEKMEVDENKQRGMEESQSSEDLHMECSEEEDRSSNKANSDETQAGTEWQEIFTALSQVRCLRGITLPACPGHILQLLLASCRQLTCINAMDLRHPSGPIRFDPAYLMEAPDLTELRIGSPTGFALTTNFNFIKLQKLSVLVMRGLSGDTWPYLGTNLTTLQVGPIKTFTTSTWANLGSMTNLQALWLEEGGSLFDSSICDGLSRLTSLRRLCLFNFVVGPKLGQALKKLTKLDRLFVLPVGTEEASIVTQNGNMLAAVEVLRHVDELVWAVHASDVYFSKGCDRIQMPPNESKIYKGMVEGPESNLWSLPKLEMTLKRQMTHFNLRIVKLDPTAASHLALATL